MNRWKEIWSSKRELEGNLPVLEKLIKADGFDSGFGSISLDAWMSYTNEIYSKLAVQPSDSVFEVGCGAGAFLYNFHKKGHRVGGLDYSDSLIKIAKKYIKNSCFTVSEASELVVEPRYDHVISNSVFFYFASLAYAEKVLLKMIAKSNNTVSILEVNDLSTKDAFLQHRKSFLSEKEYAIKYRGLGQLFFDKKWFTRIAQSNNLEVVFETQNIRNYSNNSFRYNVFFKKNFNGN